MTKIIIRNLILCCTLLAITAAQAQSLDSEQSLFLSLINNFRTQNGLAPLQVSAALQTASQWMSADMAAKSYFSHTDSLGRDPFKRMADFGYPWAPAGENLAAGNSGAQGTFNQWEASPGHRSNMLNASYRVIGIGRAYNASSPYRWYWTTNFGAYVDQVTGPSPSPIVQPPVISFFAATPSAISSGQAAMLSWNVSGATSVTIDNGVGDVTGVLSRTVAPVSTTTYRLTAYNSGGATSASTTVTVFAPAADTQAPSVPGSLYAWAASSTQVNLFWSASTDNIGVAGYQLFRNGSVLRALPPSVTSYGDRSVEPNTSYTYAIRAYDSAGNYSGLRQSAAVTTPPSYTQPTPASVSVASGSSQVAVIATAFASPLRAKVLNSSGQPVGGITVTFTAPASGASATFSGSGAVALVTTDATGLATSPALVANGIPGTYSIMASVSGLAPAAFTLTNSSASTPPPTSGALSIWGSTVPANRYMVVSGAYELGMKFRSDIAGRITGIRFYKTYNDTGTHTGSLWTADGSLLATGTFTNETASGWQTLVFNSPVPITANTTYIASYHNSSGIFAVALGYFQTQGADNGTLHALRDGVSGPNGVALPSSGGKFPSMASGSHNFWVDVLFVQ